MPEEFVFTLLYLLICLGLIYPPDVFIGAGFTIKNLFSSFLGSDKERFIMYHIKKSMLNLFIYSSLPLIYLVLLFIMGFADEVSSLFIGTTIYWQIFATTSIAFPTLALFQIQKWIYEKYKTHPIAVNLSRHCNNNNTWETVASDIDNEYRRLLGNLCIESNPIITIVVTENWICKVTPFTIFLTHQSDATLNVKEVTNFEMSDMGTDPAKFMNIEVIGSRIDPFTIRIRSEDFLNLESRLSRNINVLPNVKFHKSVHDQFIDIFKETVQKNHRYVTDIEPEICMGCLQAPSTIKLQRQCLERSYEENRALNQGEDLGECTDCFCRPMWCLDCISKWFVFRQNISEKHRWLSRKCSCPMCRATFCVLDVSLLSNSEESLPAE